MNLRAVAFGFFVLIAAAPNFGFFIVMRLAVENVSFLLQSPGPAAGVPVAQVGTRAEHEGRARPATCWRERFLARSSGVVW